MKIDKQHLREALFCALCSSTSYDKKNAFGREPSTPWPGPKMVIDATLDVDAAVDAMARELERLS